jgi:hypothetical protein
MLPVFENYGHETGKKVGLSKVSRRLISQGAFYENSRHPPLFFQRTVLSPLPEKYRFFDIINILPIYHPGVSRGAAFACGSPVDAVSILYGDIFKLFLLRVYTRHSFFRSEQFPGNQHACPRQLTVYKIYGS